jgi:hypothetical protein
MLDDVTRKIFAQLDDPMPGQRANALELLRARLEKLSPPLTFRQLADDIANTVPAQKYADLETKLRATEASLQQFQQANAQAAAAHAKQQAEIAQLRAALQRAYSNRSPLYGAWAFLMRPHILVVGAVFGLACWGYQTSIVSRVWWSLFGSDEFGAVATAATWGDGLSVPRVMMVNGGAYWVLLRGEADTTSYQNSSGRPAEFRCIHVYAIKAERGPYGDWVTPPAAEGFFGGFNWSERASACKRPAEWKTASLPSPNPSEKVP